MIKQKGVIKLNTITLIIVVVAVGNRWTLLQSYHLIPGDGIQTHDLSCTSLLPNQ